MKIELGGLIGDFFNRNSYIEEEDIKSIELFKNRCKNTDVYYSTFKYSDSNIDEALLYGSFYLDLDYEIKNDKDFNKVLKDTIYIVTHLEYNFGIPEELINIYFSGSKGFHVIIDAKVFGIEPCKDLNDKFKIIASSLNSKHTIYHTIDTRIYDKKRLFRFPNSINSKTGLYKIKLSKKELKLITINSIVELAKNQKDEYITEPYLVLSAKKEFERLLLIEHLKKSKKKIASKKFVIGDKRELLPCTAEALSVGSAKGCRNNTLILLASSLYQSGLSDTEVESEIEKWNYNNDPPLSDRELITTIRSAKSMIQSGRGYGCSSYKDLGLCLETKCNIYNKKGNIK